MTETVTPVVGMGGTIRYWTDRRAVTVIAVSTSGRKVTVQFDRATRTDDNGLGERQTYSLERDPKGDTTVFTLRANGQWVRQGDSLKCGSRLTLGIRSEYEDPSF